MTRVDSLFYIVKIKDEIGIKYEQTTTDYKNVNFETVKIRLKIMKIDVNLQNYPFYSFCKLIHSVYSVFFICPIE